MISGDDGPIIGQQPCFFFTRVYHRLDGEGHAFSQLHSRTRFPIVQNLRVFVKTFADAMTAIFPHDRKIIPFSALLDGVTNIA